MPMKALKNTVASDQAIPIWRAANRRYISRDHRSPDQMASPYRMEWALSSVWMASGTIATSDRSRKTGLRRISTARSRSTSVISLSEIEATSWRKSVTAVSDCAEGRCRWLGVVEVAPEEDAGAPQAAQKRFPSESWCPHPVQNMAPDYRRNEVRCRAPGETRPSPTAPRP